MTPPPRSREAQAGLYKHARLMSLVVMGSFSSQRSEQRRHLRSADRDGISERNRRSPIDDSASVIRTCSGCDAVQEPDAEQTDEECRIHEA